jgi:hypothetical protein
MPYVTKVKFEEEEPEKIANITNWCNFCAGRDKTFTFTIDEKQLCMFSPGRDQAFKRGSAVKKRWGLFYNVEYRENVK